MSEYIRREDAVEALDGKIIVTGHENADAVLQYMKDISNKIKSLEPADVAPVRHGHWTLVGWHKGMKVVECSCCKKRAIGSTDFCPNCGAKMDAQREE